MGLTAVTHVQSVDGFGDVELVHGGEDDGGCGQEKQHHEESEVDAQPLEPPAEALDGQVPPAEARTQAPAADLPGSAHRPHRQCPRLKWVRRSSGGKPRDESNDSG